MFSFFCSCRWASFSYFFSSSIMLLLLLWFEISFWFIEINDAIQFNLIPYNGMTEHYFFFERQKDQSNEMFTLNSCERVTNHVPFQFIVEINSNFMQHQWKLLQDVCVSFHRFLLLACWFEFNVTRFDRSAVVLLDIMYMLANSH